MSSNKYSDFITAKIDELRTAIFFDFNSPRLKFPAYLISVLKAGKPGEIWFSLRETYQYPVAAEERFFARLRFYNKNYDYYITVYGKAFIVNAESEWTDCRECNSGKAGDKGILLRLEIISSEYICLHKKQLPGFYHNFKELICGSFYHEKNQQRLPTEFRH